MALGLGLELMLVLRLSAREARDYYLRAGDQHCRECGLTLESKVRLREQITERSSGGFGSKLNSSCAQFFCRLFVGVVVGFTLCRGR